MGTELTFETLVGAIQKVHEHFSAQASRAVNISLTLRNWIVGLYIYEYEQNGSDRARHGEYLLDKLADRLRQSGMKRVDPRELRRYRQFYLTYPQIGEALTPGSRAMLSAIEELVPIRESVTPELSVNGKTILERLSFTHLTELIKIDDAPRDSSISTANSCTFLSVIAVGYLDKEVLIKCCLTGYTPRLLSIE